MPIKYQLTELTKQILSTEITKHDWKELRIINTGICYLQIRNFSTVKMNTLLTHLQIQCNYYITACSLRIQHTFMARLWIQPPACLPLPPFLRGLHRKPEAINLLGEKEGKIHNTSVVSWIWPKKHIRKKPKNRQVKLYETKRILLSKENSHVKRHPVKCRRYANRIWWGEHLTYRTKSHNTPTSHYLVLQANKSTH